MNKYLKFLAVGLLIGALSCIVAEEVSFQGQFSAELKQSELLRLKSEELAPGVRYYYFQYEKLYGVKMAVSMVVIDWEKSNLTLGIDFSDGKRLKTSEFAARNNALAATNGTYFFVRESLPYFPLKVDGKVNVSEQGAKNRGCGVIAFNANEKPFIGRYKENLNEQYSNIIQGDSIVSNGKSSQVMNEGKGKAPHTAWGVTATGKIVMLVVDGRTAESAGMNYGELADYMIKIGCVEAVSIDGGGSSSLYLQREKNNSFNGIVSHPSDNLKFDQGGERAVHDIIYIKERPAEPDVDKK